MMSDIVSLLEIKEETDVTNTNRQITIAEIVFPI
jgi:hypothetical protein